MVFRLANGFSEVFRHVANETVNGQRRLGHFSATFLKPQLQIRLAGAPSECLLQIISGEKTFSPSSPRAVSPSSFA